MTDTAIVLSKNRELTPAVWKMLGEIAPVMNVSRLFGTSSPEQATAIMLKGYELGLSITASFEFVQVIDGKPSLSPRGALALIQAKDVLETYKLTRLVDEKGAFTGYECYMKRKATEFTASFTLEDAKKALLTEGSPTSSGKRGYGNWEKYPENMCMWRAIGFAADVVCPDITGGLTTFLKMPEAFPNVDIDDNGNFVKVGAKVIDVAPPPTNRLNELLTQYTGEQIMGANNGKIPVTDAEIDSVVKVLEVEK